MKHAVIVLFLSLIIFSKVEGQSASIVMQIDSLENILQKARDDEKPALLLQLAQIGEGISVTTSRKYIKEIIHSGDSLLNAAERAEAYLMLAKQYQTEGNSDSTISCISKAQHYQLLAEGTNQEQLSKQLKELMAISFETEYDVSTKGIFTPLQYVLLALFVVFVIALLVVFFLRKKDFQKKIESKKEELQRLIDQFDAQERNIELIIKEKTSALEEELRLSRLKDLELKKALKRAEDANYLKNAFLTNMSHEIRTPLNGIIGFSSLLETELSLLENEELYSFAHGIQQSGDRLLNLLTNIIDISRIEANDIELEMQPCKIEDIVENVSELYVFTANDKGLAFKTKVAQTPEVMADNAKLMRVVNIVIDNAIKYTESGFVNVTTNFIEASNEIQIKVKDTGVGMDDSYKDYLFEAFRQESSGYSRQYQGAGLGLPLAKKLLDLMKGRIEIQSIKSVGTTVDIYIPCAWSATSSAKKELKAVSNVPQIGEIDIFIVEDDRMNRLVLEKILKKAGHVTLAVDGDEALKIINERSRKGHFFQVMLFDINLPSPWDGVKLMQKIREEHKQYRYVPFIAQTAYAMAGDREKFLDAGFDDYIAKPINRNELMTIFKNQLDKFGSINNQND